MRRLIGLAGLVTAAGALWTGWHRGFKASMWGFFPPHYGYSAYIEVAALFLAPWWPIRAFCLLALVLSVNRTAMLGVLAGWAYLGGWRRRAYCVGAFAAALLLADVFKPANTNMVRLGIWQQVFVLLKVNPHGYGTHWAVGVKGMITRYAHSDVLQALMRWGVWQGGALLLLAALTLWAILRGPRTIEKAALVALAAQSIPDNRLHHPACWVTLLAVAALAAVRAPRASERR